ncbi:MAG: glycosyltransferase [Vicinamibacterales bacterium]|nr:glycosyltransferase [Vicinamibacterales bacterium]
MFSLHIDTSRTWRGGQRQVLFTVLGLRERGHRAVLVAHPEGELARRASEGHDLIRLVPRAEVDLHAGWKLSRIIRELKPEIVHAHDPHAVALASLALSLSTAKDCPGLIASRRVAFHLKGNAFSRWKYHQVDCFIAASDAIGQMLAGDGVDPSRVVTVYEGIDVDRVQAEPVANIHAEFWLPTHAPIVGATGALTQEKGHKYLIDAAALVVREVPDARFVILGEGDLRPALERHVKELHLDKHVLLPGFRSDILSFVRAFDLFVMCSLHEGLGTSLLDAMAASKATVASDTGGIPEVVARGETGLLVPPRDHRALARAIVQLLKDSRTREAMGRAGLERVRKVFSAEQMVERTLEVYRQHAGGHHADEVGTPHPTDTTSRPARG